MAFQIQGSDKIAKFNDSPLVGQLQSLDYNPNLQTEELFEIGKTTRIAAAQELEVTGSFDFLSIGGTAGLISRMLADKDTNGAFLGYLYKKELASGTADSGTTTTLTDTGATWTVNAFANKVVYITAGTNSGLNRVIVSNTADTLTVAPAFPSAIDNTSVYNVSGGPNSYTITQDDLTDAIFDIVVNIKSDQDNFNRSDVIPRCFLTTFSGRAEAGGNASETYNFASTFVTVAEAPYHDIRSIPATKTTDTTATLLDATVDNTTHGLAYLYVDDRRLRTVNTDAAYATLGASGVITVTGLTIPDTARLQAVVWDNTTPTSTFPQVVERQTPEFFVRGYMASIFIAPASTSAPLPDEQYLRVQSLDWNVDLRTESLRQIAFTLAGSSEYCRVPTLPFQITLNASSYESEWLEWKQMLDPTQKPFGGTGTDFYGETLDFAPASFKESFAVVLQIFTKGGTLMQQWTWGDMKPETMTSRVTAGGRSEVTWSFRGSAFSIQGYNI